MEAFWLVLIASLLCADEANILGRLLELCAIEKRIIENRRDQGPGVLSSSSKVFFKICWREQMLLTSVHDLCPMNSKTF